MARVSGGDFDGSCSLIPLDCDEGQRLLEESDHKTLASHYRKQNNRTYCSLRSIAICLNGIPKEALRRHSMFIQMTVKVDEGRPLDEEDVLLVGKEAGLDVEDLNVNGMTLPNFGKLSEALGLNSFVFYVVGAESSKCDSSLERVEGLDEFRLVVLENLQKGHFVVVNYLMSSMGYVTLGGHFSPIGGYHPKQDRFLVLDVWPDTPAVWVKSEDLFNSMKDFDSSSGLPRGFCVLGIP